MKTKVVLKQVTATMLLCLIYTMLYAQNAAQQSIASTENPTTGKTSELRLYPNPSNGSIIVEYNSVHSGKVHLKVINMGGKQLFSAKEASIHGTNTYRLNLNQLASGIYILELIKHNKEICRTQFVIQKS
jgi:hypothetical protein